MSTIPKFVKKEIVAAWEAESLWLMLLTDMHAPNASTQRYVSDVVANEINDLGGVYVAGGVQLQNLSSAYDTNNAYLDADNMSIGPGANLNYRWGILYTKTGGTSQATYRIRAHIDFLVNQIVVNGTTVIQWNALGIMYVS